VHKVCDDLLITAFLLRRFEREAEIEAGDRRHYAVLQRSDGRFLEHNPASPEIDQMQAVFARDLLAMLHKELHHDGAWVIVFTDPALPEIVLSNVAEYRRFALMWVDRDGDPQFTLEWVNGESDELDFADVLLSGLESWGDRAETAWQNWKVLMRDVIDPTSEQTFKRAQGQAPKPETQLQ
jgi:hypothetical protein